MNTKNGSVNQMTLAPIHADPFDRLLVAQAMAEPMHLATHDRTIAAYGAGIMLV